MIEFGTIDIPILTFMFWAFVVVLAVIVAMLVFDKFMSLWLQCTYSRVHRAAPYDKEVKGGRLHTS